MMHRGDAATMDIPSGETKNGRPQVLRKMVYDPWSKSFLPTTDGFMKGVECRKERGVDLRHFYDEVGATLHSVCRFGPEAQGARSLVWIMDLVHGGCIESAMHECMVEALKCDKDAEAVVVDFRCDIKIPHNQSKTYRLETICQLPVKTDDDSDDDEDFGQEAITFSDSGGPAERPSGGPGRSKRTRLFVSSSYVASPQACSATRTRRRSSSSSSCR